MRWQRLFDDLEAQLEEESRAELHAAVADRTRRERATVFLVDRLAAQRGPLEAVLLGGLRVTGEVTDVGRDFVVLRGAARGCLVPLPALVAVSGLAGPAAAPTDAARVRRFGLGYALRVIARDRAPVQVTDTAGRALTGTLQAVGADFVEVDEHPLDAGPRARDLWCRRTLPFWAVVCVASC